MEQLVGEQASPIVERIVSSRIRGGTAEDVRSDVVADLISRLRELKQSGDRETIRDFRAYSAVAAYHGCDKYYRRAFPQRYRLENQLRYLLGKHVRLAIWVGPDGEWLCGNKVWRHHHPLVKAAAVDTARAGSREAILLVEKILDELTAPLAFDELVERVARHWRISDKRELRGLDELTRVWNGLPLDDLKIAARLGLNRQRVIDLRRTARQRLNKLT